MTLDANIAWVAGILEGEGSFFNTGKAAPLIQLSMSDKDVVYKTRDIIGSGTINTLNMKKYGSTYKMQYRLRVFGTDAIKWMEMIRPYMLSRRAEKIDSIISVVRKFRPNL